MKIRLFAQLLGNVPASKVRRDTDLTSQLSESGDVSQRKETVRRLEIEEKPGGMFFLYRYNGSGQCVGDTKHLNVEDAKARAASEYDGCLLDLKPASPYQRLGKKRYLKDTERLLIEYLLRQAAGYSELIAGLRSAEVQEMDDGGMGSLYFPHPTKDPETRRFGKCISEHMYKDTDGVDILVYLDVDDEGDISELDVWKTDSSPTITLWKTPSESSKK